MNGALPARLDRARTIGVYAPSGSFADFPDKARLFEAGVDRLRTHGFAVRLSEHCRSSWYHTSAPASERAADLHQLLADDEVDVILPALGGHVAAQLLRLIDFPAVAASGKALFGFSDNSLIPLAASAMTGAVSFHSACDVVFGFGRHSAAEFALTEASFLDVVRHRRFDLRGSGGWRTVQSGAAEGITLGGNLHSLTTLAGTPWWPDWRGKILFWEACDAVHAVAQDLVFLWNTGAFDELAGMVIGRVAGLGEDFYPPDRVTPLDILLLDVIGLRGRFPIVWEADIGHDVGNVTIPLGARTALTASDSEIAWSVTG